MLPLLLWACAPGPWTVLEGHQAIVWCSANRTLETAQSGNWLGHSICKGECYTFAMLTTSLGALVLTVLLLQ